MSPSWIAHAVTSAAVRCGARAVSGVLCLLVLPVVAARLFGGRPPQPWPMLAALAPVAVPVAGLAFLAALAGPRQWALLPGLLLALLLWWQVAPAVATWWRHRDGVTMLAAGDGPALGHGSTARTSAGTPAGGTPAGGTPAGGTPAGGSGAGTGTGRRVRVLTINAWDGQADALAIADLVRDRQVDVLAVQELTPYLVDRLHAAGLDAELPYRLARPAPTFTGTGLWSRWPMTPLPDLTGMRSAAPRAVVHPPSSPAFTAFSAHPTAPLPGGDRDWLSDLTRFRKAFTEVNRPVTTVPTVAGPTAESPEANGSVATPDRVLLIGDFNATRDHAPFRALLAAGLEDALDAAPGGFRLAYTWPADRLSPPLMRLDHILFTPGHLTCLNAATVTIPNTDHRGVIATLELT